MSGAIKQYPVNFRWNILNFGKVLIPLLAVVFFSRCGEPCDADDPFFEMAAFSFNIENPGTHESFFYLNSEYNISDFKIMDDQGNELEMSGIHLFDVNQNISSQVNAAIISPVTRTYYLYFSESDTDTLMVTFKGMRSEPCGYEEMQFVKVLYNGKVAFYDLYPQDDNFQFTLYKIP